GPRHRRMLGSQAPAWLPPVGRLREQSAGPGTPLAGDPSMASRLGHIDLFDPDTFAGGPPHETFALLRREAPVYRNPRPGAPPFWAITRYQDVVSVSRDWTTYSSERRGVILREPPDDAMETMRLLLLNMDPPRHTKVRAIVNKG